MMSETVDSSLRTAVKGAALVLFGTVVSMLLWFAIKVFIVRNISVDDFGMYTLAVTVASVLSIVALLGIPQGITKYISIFLGEGRSGDAEAVSRSSLHAGAVSSLVACLLLFALSDPLARHVFYKPGMALLFKVASFLIPFSAMTIIMVNILRGYGVVRPKVYYQDIGQPLYFMMFIGGLFILFEFSHINLLYAFVLSSVMVLVSISSYGYKKLGLVPLPLKMGQHYWALLRFSLPLLAAGVWAMVLGWTDTLMLGRYTTAEDVGLYNVSITVAKLLMVPLSALIFVYMPIAGELHARGQSTELKRTYQVLTKWVFSVTLPVFFVLFFFPEITISFLFGERLVDSAVPLRILAVGFLFHVLLGTNGTLLLVLGFSRQLLYITISCSVLNIAMNYIFIKRLGFGISGAAAATAASYIISNSIVSVLIYRSGGFHPFTAKYLKPVAGSAIAGLAIYAAAKNLPLHSWMLPGYFVLFLCGYGLSLFLTRSLDMEDIAMLEAISAKTGLEMRAIRKILRRFIHK
jgi:O-antigen/teichoic acid export membrane protein